MENKIKILYVDDEPLNLELFAMVFKKKYNVITAGSGFEGLEILKKDDDICIVISDMKMPEMNGIEFINKAKKEYSNLVYFILTGFEITDEIAEALNEKLINKYFKKPFNSKEIEDTIKDVSC